MSDQKFPRRTLLKGALLGVAAVPMTALLSHAAVAASDKDKDKAKAKRVSPDEPQAKSLGYIEDAKKVDAKANPNFKPGQICANCLQAPGGKPGMAEVPCNIFAGRPVAGNGWCKVYVKRP